MSHYFPMVSSSPPPFDDSNHSFEDDNEETDDFGDFSSAGNILHESPICHSEINYNNLDFPQQLPLKDGVENTIGNGINQNINEESVNQTFVSNDEDDCPEFKRSEDSFMSTEDAVVEQSTEENNVEEENVIENCLNLAEEPSFEDNNTDVTEKSGVNVDLEFEEEDKEVEEILQNFSKSDEEIIPSSESEEPELEISNVNNNVDDDIYHQGESALEHVKECLEVNEILEDDDFADFQRDGEKLENDFDDFQDFESGGNLCEEKESDKFEANFAAFDDVNFTQSFPSNLDVPVNESDDEFGHFEFTTPIQVSSFEQLIFTTLCTVFVKDEVISDDNGKVPSQIIQLDDALKQECSKASCDCIWEKVKDIDSTQALTYHWSNSHSNKRLLHSLHLNSQNFLPGAKWASSIPLFAANLGSDPLEPTKAPMKITEDNISISEIPYQSTTTLDTVVPPVQFDWGSSGLINPLDDSSSALLDLDFFITNDYVISKSSATKTIHSLETEFLGSEGGSKPFYSERKPAVSSLVDKILSEATIKGGGGGKYKQNISKEAKKILTSLQDLSFMQARVLMFPIRDGAGYE